MASSTNGENYYLTFLRCLERQHHRLVDWMVTHPHHGNVRPRGARNTLTHIDTLRQCEALDDNPMFLAYDDPEGSPCKQYHCDPPFVNHT